MTHHRKYLVCLFWLALAVLPANTRAAAPADPPPIGLTVTMDYVRTRDEDTIEARIPGSAYVWALRLIDVWGPELDAADPAAKALAKQGTAFVKDACQAHPKLIVYIPLDRLGPQPLKALTFDRIPAWVWLDRTVLTLNEMVVMHGYASSTKRGPLGR